MDNMLQRAMMTVSTVDGHALLKVQDLWCVYNDRDRDQ